MSTIIIERMRLINFMGIRDQEVFFKPNVTTISGYNGTGKSTITHAFPWVLFGKNANEKETFSIKTIDETGTIIDQIEHEVQIDLRVNGDLLCIRKVLQEKWTKKRGALAAENTGNQNLYYWNEVPKKESEFTALVAALIPEKMFKLITNPLYFNTALDWQERREVLFSMAPPPDIAEILKKLRKPDNSEQVDEVSKMLISERKTVDDCRDQFKGKAKNIKEELKSIPLRVDEAYRQIPEDEDFSKYENEIAAQEKVIAEIDLQKQNLLTASKTANEGLLKKQSQKNEMLLAIQRMRHDNTAKYNDELLAKKGSLRNVDADIKERDAIVRVQNESIKELQDAIDKANSEIETQKSRNAVLLGEWKEINARQFNPDGADITTTCYACKQALPHGDVEANKENARQAFENKKAMDLGAKREQGVAAKTLVSKLEERVKLHEGDIQWCKKIIEETLEELSVKNRFRDEIITEIDKMEANPPVDTPDILAKVEEHANFVIPKPDDLNFDEFKFKASAAQDIIKAANAKLANRDAKKRVEDRIAELQDREVTLSQDLTDIEALQFVLENYNKRRIEELTASVNSKFDFTRFKLFERQVNGTDKEVCIALVNTNGSWVPFPDANTAGQLNAGIDIINTICLYNSITAPIFIDNSEGVGQFIKTASQMINLRFSQDPKLLIS